MLLEADIYLKIYKTKFERKYYHIITTYNQIDWIT